MSQAAEKLDLRRVKADAEAQAPQESTEKPPSLVPREQTLNIKYKNPETGELHQSNVQSRVMTGDERGVVARMEAALAGVPAVTVTALAASRFRALSVCAVQLREPPEWLLRWLAEDNFLLEQVYSALEVHDLTYFRGNPTEGGGEAFESRVAVVAEGAS